MAAAPAWLVDLLTHRREFLYALLFAVLFALPSIMRRTWRVVRWTLARLGPVGRWVVAKTNAWAAANEKRMEDALDNPALSVAYVGYHLASMLLSVVLFLLSVAGLVALGWSEKQHVLTTSERWIGLTFGLVLWGFWWGFMTRWSALHNFYKKGRGRPKATTGR